MSRLLSGLGTGLAAEVDHGVDEGVGGEAFSDVGDCRLGGQLAGGRVRCFTAYGAGPTGSVTTPGESAVTVPAGVTAMHATLVGGQGGSGSADAPLIGPPGGKGAAIDADLDVTPGEPLFLAGAVTASTRVRLRRVRMVAVV